MLRLKTWEMISQANCSTSMLNAGLNIVARLRRTRVSSALYPTPELSKNLSLSFLLFAALWTDELGRADRPPGVQVAQDLRRERGWTNRRRDPAQLLPKSGRLRAQGTYSLFSTPLKRLSERTNCHSGNENILFLPFSPRLDLNTFKSIYYPWTVLYADRARH